MANSILNGIKSVVSGVASWGNSLVKNVISTKVKSEPAKKVLTLISDIVTDAVICVNETYVDSLKESGKFDKTAQGIALKKARIMVVNQITGDVRDYIIENYGDVETYINAKIEETVEAVKAVKAVKAPKKMK